MLFLMNSVVRTADDWVHPLIFEDDQVDLDVWLLRVGLREEGLASLASAGPGEDRLWRGSRLGESSRGTGGLPRKRF